MYLPIELLAIIYVYKNDLELFETYERRLSTFAHVVSYQPSMRMISTREARHAFVRAFPHLIVYQQHVAGDLEAYLGPAVIMENGVGFWFFLQRERIFSYIERDDPTQPPRTV